MASGPISSVQSLSRVWLFETPWTTASQGSLSITNSQNLLKLFSIELVMPSKHLVLCCPLLLPSVFPSIRVFSNESVLHIRGPKYWRFSFNISPSNEYSGLISKDLLAVWGTLKSLLQHHSSKASIVQRSAFLIVQKQLLNQQKPAQPTNLQAYCLISDIWVTVSVLFCSWKLFCCKDLSLSIVVKCMKPYSAGVLATWYPVD